MLGQSLIEAVECGDAARVESLLAAGADANASAEGGTTLLMRAAAIGDLTIVAALLRWGAEVESKRRDGWTALILASFFGHAEVSAALLAHGADVNAEDEMRMTAHKWAQAKGRMNVCALLEDIAMKRLVPNEIPSYHVDYVPGAEFKRRSAAGEPDDHGEGAPGEAPEAAGASTASRRPVRRRMQRTPGAIPSKSVFGELVLLNAGVLTNRNRIRYSVGALCTGILILTGFFYLQPRALKKFSAAPPATLSVERQAPSPATLSGPDREVDPDSGLERTHHAQSQKLPPTVRTPGGGGTMPQEVPRETRPPSTASDLRNSEPENLKAASAEGMAVGQTKAASEVSLKREVSESSSIQPTPKETDEVRVAVVPPPPPVQKNESGGRPSPSAAPAAGPAQPIKKKVIRWP